MAAKLSTNSFMWEEIAFSHTFQTLKVHYFLPQSFLSWWFLDLTKNNISWGDF